MPFLSHQPNHRANACFPHSICHCISFHWSVPFKLPPGTQARWIFRPLPLSHSPIAPPFHPFQAVEVNTTTPHQGCWSQLCQAGPVSQGRCGWYLGPALQHFRSSGTGNQRSLACRVGPLVGNCFGPPFGPNGSLLCTGLERLSLRGNAIADLSVLTTMRRLTDIDVCPPSSQQRQSLHIANR